MVPEGIDLVFLPAYSPELHPAERLWRLVDKPLANRAVGTIAALEELLVDRCRTLEADPARRHAHTHYHWWPPSPHPYCSSDYPESE